MPVAHPPVWSELVSVGEFLTAVVTTVTGDSLSAICANVFIDSQRKDFKFLNLLLLPARIVILTPGVRFKKSNNACVDKRHTCVF